MSDKTISKMSKVLSNAQKVYESDLKFIYLEEFFRLYESLDPKNQKNVKKEYLFIANEKLGEEHYIRKQYQQSLNHLLKAYNSPLFNYEWTMVQTRIKQHIVKSSLSFLQNDSELLNEIKTISDSLLNDIDNGKIHFKGEINRNARIVDAIAAEEGLKTVISFLIPSPIIPFPKNLPIKFKFNETDYEINFLIIKKPINSSFIKENDSFISQTEDKYGLFNNTWVTVTVYNYIDPSELIEINTITDREYDHISKALLDVINALNFFIKHYRVITESFWFKKINYKMIGNFQISYVPEIIGPSNVTSQFNFGPEVPTFEDNNLKLSLNNESIPLWKILLLDAKDYSLSSDYREAIYAINGAFENYLMLKALERLTIGWNSEENAIEYLKGIPIYQYHNMKDCVDEETFDRCVQNKKINPYVPPVNQILKECYNVHKFSIKRKELNKLVNKIRKKRNDVMHGLDIKEDLESIAFEAIKSFENFVNFF